MYGLAFWALAGATVFLVAWPSKAMPAKVAPFVKGFRAAVRRYWDGQGD